MTLKPGDQAPDFTLPDAGGQPVRLADLLAHGPVVVYFYPRDETSICTAEACSFRDRYEVFREAGAQVVGISRDSVASHRRFADHHGLPFTLLADEEARVHKAWGIGRLGGLVDGRKTFVIDRKGTIRLAFSSLFSADGHVSRALDAVRQLAA